MAKLITRPSALVTQGNLKLYTTSLRVADLLTEDFYTIERLDPENVNEKGYQRLLNRGRAKKLADYLIDGQENQDAFLPTSILLATDKDIEFNAGNNTVTIDVEQVCPFSVVDGQHRIEGLKLAAQKNSQLILFEVPVNIAVNLPEIHQMCHFLIVNTTQKSFEDEIIYVGLTDNLQRRFGEHRESEEKTKPTVKGTAFWFYFLTCEDKVLLKLERTWLNQYEVQHGCLPILNKVSSPIH